MGGCCCGWPQDAHEAGAAGGGAWPDAAFPSKLLIKAAPAAALEQPLAACGACVAVLLGAGGIFGWFIGVGGVTGFGENRWCRGEVRGGGIEGAILVCLTGEVIAAGAVPFDATNTEGIVSLTTPPGGPRVGSRGFKFSFLRTTTD